MPQQPIRRKKRKKSKGPLLVVLLLFVIILLCIFFFAQKGNNNEESQSSSISSSQSSEIQNSSSSENTSQSQGQSSSSLSSSSENQDDSSSSSIVSTSVDPSDWRLVIASAAHPLGNDYSVELSTVTGSYKVDSRILEPLTDMLTAAQEDGVSLAITSAYRTVQRQTELYDAKVAEYEGYGYSHEEALAEAARWVAPPGTSEHNTGLALDIIYPGYYEEYGDLNDNFEKSEAFAWLYEHCTEYGFVLRYPKDKQDITGITYEPWHYRYVGVENARAMKENNQCLEEYLGLA